MELISARHAGAASVSSARDTLGAGEIAWIAALPCALLTIAAIALLGDPLGAWLFGPSDAVTVLPFLWVEPEPVEHARVALALCGAFALPAFVLASRGRLPDLSRTLTRTLVVAAQACAGAWLLVAVLAQERVFGREEAQSDRIFAPRTLIAGAVLTALALAVLKRQTIAEAVTRTLQRESRARAIGCASVAAVLTALWLSTAINSDATIGGQIGNNLIPWHMDETFAVLDGRTPLVDFHPQYAQLWPYVIAAVMALAGGSSLALWTTTMAAISGVAMLSMYALFRRVVGSSLLALGVFVPFLATSFFIRAGTLSHRQSPAGVFSAWPLRYAGPYLLAWLTARHLDHVAPRRAWLLFAAAGLVGLNNPELGIPAFAATCVALATMRASQGARSIAVLAGETLAGLLIAIALVALLTLVRSGELPHLGLLFEFSRIFATGGWLLQRMPTLGLHIVMFMTFGAALTTATVRVVQRDPGQLLTGMLAWSGTFGLLAAGYYAGRSEPLQLTIMLSAWSLAIVLLLVLVVQRLAARAWRRPTFSELLVLFAFGLAVCSIAQLPTPWSQVARLREHVPAPGYTQQAAIDFIDRTTRPGETVAMIVPLGHQIAYRLHLHNVAPYSGAEPMVTTQQIDDTVELVRRLHVHKVFAGIYDDTGGYTLQSILLAFKRAGFTIRGQAAVPLAYLLSDRPVERGDHVAR